MLPSRGLSPCRWLCLRRSRVSKHPMSQHLCKMQAYMSYMRIEAVSVQTGSHFVPLVYPPQNDVSSRVPAHPRPYRWQQPETVGRQVVMPPMHYCFLDFQGPEAQEAGHAFAHVSSVHYTANNLGHSVARRRRPERSSLTGACRWLSSIFKHIEAITEPM